MSSAACGPEWPGRTANAVDPQLVGVNHGAAPGAPGPITTIDVLPMDLALWTEPGNPENPDELQAMAATRILNAAVGIVGQRHYAIGRLLDWDSGPGNPQGLSHDEVLATVNTLSHYGEQVDAAHGQLPVPHLPARLGVASNSDATLYIGGWSYVAQHHESRGAHIAKDIAIGLLIAVAIVAVIAVVAAASKGGGGGGHGGGGGGLHGGGGGGFHGGGGGLGGVHVASGIGRGLGPLHTEGTVIVPLRTFDLASRFAVDVADHADWEEAPQLPRKGDSQMYVEMTLVDNRSGLAVWHSHQVFPANASQPKDIARVAQTLLASLPPPR